ncbi:sigma-70 family RNA polymerase sigma factor [Denitrobaculum tricleocarpae]|nr:sigma-70 family RNA polymerase sigma factor [Denitrobaculum tricleocarpae]
MTLHARQEAFEAMTRPLLDSLYRTALRMTHEPQAAEDLVQDTCLKAFRALHRYEAGTNYRAWIFKIMTNTCIDRRRARPEPLAMDLEEFPAGAGSGEAGSGGSQATGLGGAGTVLPFPGLSGSDPERDLQQKDFRTAALRSVEALPQELRIVVLLAIFEEFSYAEIAQVVGCPIGTVRSRLSRGRQALKKDLSRFARSDPGEASGVVKGTSQRRSAENARAENARAENARAENAGESD